MGKYFGTDGFRGEANVTLTVEDAYKVGRFLGWYYGKKKPEEKCRVVIGKDTRGRRIPAPCHHDSQCFLCGPHRRIQLRNYDFRQP
mgnify:CR=1 FL=1